MARSLGSAAPRSMIFGMGLLYLLVGELASGSLLSVLGDSLDNAALTQVLVAVGALCVLCAGLLPCKGDPLPGSPLGGTSHYRASSRLSGDGRPSPRGL